MISCSTTSWKHEGIPRYVTISLRMPFMTVLMSPALSLDRVRPVALGTRNQLASKGLQETTRRLPLFRGTHLPLVPEAS